MAAVVIAVASPPPSTPEEYINDVMRDLLLQLAKGIYMLPGQVRKVPFQMLLDRMRTKYASTLDMDELVVSYIPLLRTRWETRLQVELDYTAQLLVLTNLYSAYRETPLGQMMSRDIEPKDNASVKYAAAWLVYKTARDNVYVDLGVYRSDAHFRETYGSPPPALVAAAQYVQHHTQEAVDEAVKQGWIEAGQRVDL